MKKNLYFLLPLHTKRETDAAMKQASTFAPCFMLASLALGMLKSDASASYV